MSKISVYGIKNCDTMKKAFSWLGSQGLEYDFIDYKKAGVVDSNIDRWMSACGWEKLLNTRGLMWKKLTDAERADVDQAKARSLMVQYPSLIKRPVLEYGATLLVGFSPEEYEVMLK